MCPATCARNRPPGIAAREDAVGIGSECNHHGVVAAPCRLEEYRKRSDGTPESLARNGWACAMLQRPF